MTNRVVLASVWMGLTACMAVAATYWQWSRAVALHEREATVLHRIVSQRVDQHDAHLTGVSALVTSSDAPPLDALKAVAATIIQFYPRILAVDIIALDHGAELPPVFTSRSIPQSVPMDLIATAAQRGSRRAETISATHSGTGSGTEATGRYLLVKRAPNSDAARYALSLEIDSARLVATEGTVSSNTDISLALPDGRSIYSRSSYNSDARPIAPVSFGLQVRAERTLASPSQSMGLALQRETPLVSLVPWSAIAAFATVSGLLLVLFRSVAVARRAEKDAVVRAGASAQEARIAHATRINAMGELSLGIAHELTQPLAALLSQSQAGLRLLKSDAHDRTAIAGVLEANARHAKRAGALLQKLRDWNSSDPPSNQTVDLNQVVTEIASLNRADLERRGISLQLNLPAAAPLAKADQVGVEQIVQNLFANARDACAAATRSGCLISVTTFADGGRVGFTVADNGPGFDPDAINRLFEPFFTSKADGMGLGLSICRRLVDGFGGDIRAANRTDGMVGAVITVALPVDRQAGAQDPARAVAVRPGRAA